MRTAIVMYGQPRTWSRCLPRFLDQLRGLRLDSDVQLFCNVKDYNTYENSTADSTLSGLVSGDELMSMRSMLQSFDPGLRWSVSEKRVDDLRKVNSWHYTSMFSSIQMAAIPLLTQRCHYDAVLLTRYDVMYDSLKPLLSIEPFSVYSEHTSIRYANESFSLGLQDYYLYGDRMSMQLLIGSTFSATANLSYPIFKNFGFRGPGVYLRNLALRSNLGLRESPMRLAIVRPSAPHDADFAQHSDYWKTAHRAAVTQSPMGPPKAA